MITLERYNQIISGLEGMSYRDWEMFKKHIDLIFAAKQKRLETQLRLGAVAELGLPDLPLLQNYPQ